VSLLVDTDVVIGFLTGDPTARQLLASLRPRGLAISIITYVEVYDGIYGSRDPKAADQTFRAFLGSVRVVGIRREVARQAGRLRSDLRRRGLPVKHRALDLLIAATALNLGLELVTRNQRHYADIALLKLY
jgi:tRNA(fMet)-specific endonuclease VapC